MRARLKFYSIGVVVLIIFGFLCLSNPLSAKAGPDVTVINTPDNAVPVVVQNGTGQTKQPYEIYFELNDINIFYVDTIPAGKFFTIEYISIYADRFDTATNVPAIKVYSDSTWTILPIELTFFPGGTGTFRWLFSGRVLMFAYESVMIECAPASIGKVLITGYLADQM